MGLARLGRLPAWLLVDDPSITLGNIGQMTGPRSAERSKLSLNQYYTSE